MSTADLPAIFGEMHDRLYTLPNIIRRTLGRRRAFANPRRLIHPFLKLAVSRARYCSSRELATLMAGFERVAILPIDTARWIPSIVGVEGFRPKTDEVP